MVLNDRIDKLTKEIDILQDAIEVLQEIEEEEDLKDTLRIERDK